MRQFLLALTLLLIAVWGSTVSAKRVYIPTNGIASVQPSNCPFAQDNGCAAAAVAQTGSVAATLFIGSSGRAPGGMLNLLNGTPTNYSTSDTSNS